VAETELRELQRDEPTCLEACVLLGDIYRDHGLARRAEIQYRRALELKPGHEGATEQLQALAGAVARPRAMVSARR
jgi:Flp pilus assembly protein TadD